MFWAIATGLALLVLLPIVVALVRGDGAGAADADLAIYRDQLAEIDRDLDRGLLAEDEAERTRLEVQRRLLEADRAAHDAPRRAPPWARYGLAGLATLVVGGGALAIYLAIGAPGYRDLPLKTRIALAEDTRERRPSQQAAEEQAAPLMPPPAELEPEFAQLMADLRQVMEQRPDDTDGFRLLARNEAAAGNFRAARAAQERLVSLLGDDAQPEDLAVLAELMVLAAGGFVTNEAESVIDRALTADPANGRALYYKGLSLAQIGRADQAFALWRGLLERGPETAPWVAPIRQQIGDLATRAGVRYDPPAPARGPSAEDVDAAAAMSAEDRAAMIGNMVSGLSQRLATEGGPSSDWAQLIVALGVLGETERAQAILGEARQVFAESAGDLARIDEAAERAGLGE
ncbi:c-type cytochrome biogenesis protein CcmI [Maribius pontilimi]|uniref:C-type cytochrome biogenesis protein CcmI n=1 Tax=Palleronia pontilimi TaxID=1964209 RepID=A0A934M8Z1_9RHOB|nr:c-type cytochrome biogenesis protein CcmI [Palleronia pontilimi]MBJ3761942.1 c-type cytochrome biogenesis protein CcmI [Palleronia pontilimi]